MVGLLIVPDLRAVMVSPPIVPNHEQHPSASKPLDSVARFVSKTHLASDRHLSSSLLFLLGRLDQLTRSQRRPATTTLVRELILMIIVPLHPRLLPACDAILLVQSGFEIDRCVVYDRVQRCLTGGLGDDVPVRRRGRDAGGGHEARSVEATFFIPLHPLGRRPRSVPHDPLVGFPQHPGCPKTCQPPRPEERQARLCQRIVPVIQGVGPVLPQPLGDRRDLFGSPADPGRPGGEDDGHGDRTGEGGETRRYGTPFPSPSDPLVFPPLGEDQVKEKGRAKDERDKDAVEDVVTGDPDIISTPLGHSVLIEPGDIFGLIKVIAQGGRAQRFADDAKDHGELVDDELGSSEVVRLVPHVRGFEFGRMDLTEVETPERG